MEKKDFKIGDAVLVVSTESNWGKWILGRISDVFPGKDNHVWVVKVRIGDQEYIHHYLNCASLNLKNVRGLINQSLSKKGRMILRKYNNINDKILHKRTYKQTECHKYSRIKDGVERCA